MLAVKLNRKRLVIVLEDQIYLYDIQTMKLLNTIATSPNPNGKRSYVPIAKLELAPNPQQRFAPSHHPRTTATSHTLFHRKHLLHRSNRQLMRHPEAHMSRQQAVKF